MQEGTQTVDLNEAALFASRFINHTNQHIFLTGKAGTGKTTFLRQLIKNTYKNVVVAAPTGIAAINAGGVTLHSMFQLPFGSFVPERLPGSLEHARMKMTDPSSLMKGFHMGKQRRRVIHEMELLVIDEVSMLRADLLDAIDTVLRSVRRSSLPFGGVQILFIGDLLQLPPVIRDEEWKVLKNYYKSVFFFESRAVKKSPPVYIEFEKIYRQDEPDFIRVLNNLRNDCLTREDIQLLNSRYKPEKANDREDNFVFLTTHNQKADAINSRRLNELQEKSFFYEASITGEFNENSYPIDKQLELKLGSQVMFIKNDPSIVRRFYNGKIGRVTELKNDMIKVICEDSTEEIEVTKYEWQNLKYTVEESSNEIREEVAGTFSHFPLKLAWAITIHKSQGLTFNKAILDIGSAFAPGQIYVALSRLTSLRGLYLTSLLPETIHKQPEEVAAFATTKAAQDELAILLNSSTKAYLHNYAVNAFRFNEVSELIREHCSSYTKSENRSAKQKYLEWAEQLRSDVENLKVPADRFIVQLDRMFSSGAAVEDIRDRLIAARNYFLPLLKEKIKGCVTQILLVKQESKVKEYLEELAMIESVLFKKTQAVNRAVNIVETAINGKDIDKNSLKDEKLLSERASYFDQIVDIASIRDSAEKKKVRNRKGFGKRKASLQDGDVPEKKKTKGESAKTSFEQFREGKSIKEIAEARAMTLSTIESHLMKYLELGEIHITELVKDKKLELITNLMESEPELTTTEIVQRLESTVSFAEVRMVRIARVKN